MKYFIALLLLFLSVPCAQAKDLTIKTANDHIDVTVGFGGASIDVFGDRRDTSADIAIVLEGPKVDMTIWKKARIMGAWINTSYIAFNGVPTYYNFASTLDVKNDKKREILFKNGIGFEAIIKSLTKNESGNLANTVDFQNALKAKKIQQHVFFDEPAKIEFLSENFFHARFNIPASVPTGEYHIHSYLIKNGVAKEHSYDIFKVEQVGLNAFIYNAAHKNKLLYALTCIAIAVFAGWAISVLKVKL